MSDDLTRLTDEEREELFSWLDTGGDPAEIVERFISARLAGAGAQVTEAAVSAAAEAMWLHVQREARAALSAALPNMGTGQSEADLRARISALADEWDERVKTLGACSGSDCAGCNVGRCANQLRNLLDRPAAAEGNET